MIQLRGIVVFGTRQQIDEIKKALFFSEQKVAVIAAGNQVITAMVLEMS